MLSLGVDVVAQFWYLPVFRQTGLSDSLLDRLIQICYLNCVYVLWIYSECRTVQASMKALSRPARSAGFL